MWAVSVSPAAANMQIFRPSAGDTDTARTAQKQLDTQERIAGLKAYTTLRAVEISAGSSLGSAHLSSSASVKAAKISAAVGHARNSLERRKLEEVTLRELPPRIQKLVHDAATANPEFVKKLKSWSMGYENVVATALVE